MKEIQLNVGFFYQIWQEYCKICNFQLKMEEKNIESLYC